MRPDDFRRLALGMQDAVEGAHMGHPDFRVHNRIFATLQSGDRFGMVVLTPDQQEACVREHPETFSPEAGAWGRQGCTRVRLESADEEAVGAAMTLAWQNTVAKGAARSRRSRGTARRKGDA